MNKRYLPILILLMSLSPFIIIASKSKTVCIGFYNLENLFDTKRDTTINDEEYLPDSPKAYTLERYQHKLSNMATAIDSIGGNYTTNGPDILGVCEVENRGVLEDLINTSPINDNQYSIIHFDSPDKRGIDVALLYRKKVFKVKNQKSYHLKIEGQDDFFTRDQLLVSGKLKGETTHIIVNHWPSRYGGEEKSRPFRMAAAELTRHIVDSLQANDAQARIIIMGDFNDDPTNPSITDVLEAKGKDAFKNKEALLFNPMADIHNPENYGSLIYRGYWNLFDQIIISKPFMDNNKGLQFVDAKVYNADFLRVQEGKYAGYTYRTYIGSKFDGGYSDHFPVYMILKK